jgi:hypothetical protein
VTITVLGPVAGENIIPARRQVRQSCMRRDSGVDDGDALTRTVGEFPNLLQIKPRELRCLSATDQPGDRADLALDSWSRWVCGCRQWEPTFVNR